MTRGARSAASPLPTGTRVRPVRSRLSGRRAALAGAMTGILGPVAFTAAWVTAAFRQPGLAFAAPQISGLGADDAREPWLMISGFVVLGGCAIGFGTALRKALGGRRAGPGPRLMQAAGVLTIAAGLLRRDHVLLTTGPESWHNQAHDIVSAVVYLLLVTVPLLLARRFSSDQRWRGLTVPLIASSAASAALLVAFYSSPGNSWDATLQRIAVSLPLAAIVAVAIRLARLAGSADLLSPGDADASGHAHPARTRQPE
jgi:hypothetical membrane protein